MYIAAGQEQTTPREKILMSTETLSRQSFATSFKSISLKSDFIHFCFHDFIHVHSPGTEADNLLGTKV